METGPMKKLILAAVCAFAAPSAAVAQAGFNPGTVVSNVYETLAAYGCGSGFGFSPVGCNYSHSAPGHERETDGAHRRFGTRAGNGTSAGLLR